MVRLSTQLEPLSESSLRAPVPRSRARRVSWPPITSGASCRLTLPKLSWTGAPQPEPLFLIRYSPAFVLRTTDFTPDVMLTKHLALNTLEPSEAMVMGAFQVPELLRSANFALP